MGVISIVVLFSVKNILFNDKFQDLDEPQTLEVEYVSTALMNYH